MDLEHLKMTMKNLAEDMTHLKQKRELQSESSDDDDDDDSSTSGTELLDAEEDSKLNLDASIKTPSNISAIAKKLVAAKIPKSQLVPILEKTSKKLEHATKNPN